MDFFQIPVLPETFFGFLVSGNPRSLWKLSSDEGVADYLSVFREFDGRRSTINWYRANKDFPIQYGNVSLPTILIWGNQDPAVGRAGVEMTKQYMKGEYSMLELDAGHALVQEKFERVNQEILNHIQQHPIKD